MPTLARRPPAGRSVPLLLALSALVGCSSYPITEGSHQTLPRQNQRVAVVGAYPSATGMAVKWLAHHGVVPVEASRTRPAPPDRAAEARELRKNAEARQRLARDSSADYLLVVETPQIEGEEGAPYLGPSGIGSSPTIWYHARVTIEGYRADTGESVWSGSAFYPNVYEYLDEGLKELTCQALATAWGLRPSGHYPLRNEFRCDVVD